METHPLKRPVTKLSKRRHQGKSRVTKTKAERRTGHKGPRHDIRRGLRFRRAARRRRASRAAGRGKKPHLGVRKRRMGR